MDSKMKTIIVISLILGAVSIALFATPVKAYVDRSENGDLLQTRDVDRSRTQGCERTSECTRCRSAQRANQRARNNICNFTKSMQQDRHQHREKAGSLGN